MGIALLLVARRIVLGTASVGDVPMVQGAAGEGFRGFGDSDGFLGPRFISAEKIPLNLHGDYDKQIIRIPIQQPSIMENKRDVFVAQHLGGEMIYAPGN